MEESKDDCGTKAFVKGLTLGVTRILESLPGVQDVKFVPREPAERHRLLSWEQRHNCILPDDLKDFYLTLDGFHLTWSAKFEGISVPVGSMVINSLSYLKFLSENSLYSLPNAPTLMDLEAESDGEGMDNHPEKPHFDYRSRIFELDSCSGNGKVCLVYKKTQPGVLAKQCEVWFLDRALYWHFLTDSFTAYYRIMITHLGLPEWQYRFTSYGPGPRAKQWSCLYQPLTSTCELQTGVSALNQFDPNKAFRSKTKPQVSKKKPPTQHIGAPQKTTVASTVGRITAPRK
ncbi:tubulin polyglutamylase complex subunit 2 [Polypterus senegalus]|uniref:tubulin polyglutamylase complex subunit 2 n=1 Tax=Polypterus senegalus TaxID=55291 RepID=UPI00196314D2|nr:tubulin polyglutamylase complex subunit 2 [Polypterus senegalus]